jgi:hypothetical protein
MAGLFLISVEGLGKNKFGENQKAIPEGGFRLFQHFNILKLKVK